MIDWIRGPVVRRIPRSNRVVVDAGGVGYGIEVATLQPEFLPGPGEMLELHLSTIVSDSAIRICGFLDPASKDMFEVVIGVSGVGPKLGMALLAALPSQDLAAAVLSHDIRALKAIPGVGAKTAERLILELRDRVADFAAGGSRTGLGTPTVSSPSGQDTVVADVIHAMVSMGVKQPLAEKAASKAREILGFEGEFQELMREALRHRR